MKNLDLAREWAEWSKAVDQGHPHTPATAAAEVILSLPDRWYDADKVREAIIDQIANYPQGTVGRHVAEEIAGKLQTLLDPTQPRPEDVPAGEVWIVQHDDREWIGRRSDSWNKYPWLVIGRGHHDFDYCYDTDITLISHLVPEEKP